MSKKTTKTKTGSSNSSALFTPREHAILAEYLRLQHLRPKEAEDPTLLDPIDPETWDESTQGIGVPPPSDLQGDLATNLQAAVANICLSTASDLPQWAISRKEGEIFFGRPLKKPGDRPARILLPQTVARISWATSGPGISWPEKYYLTRIPHYECWILTASQETSEVSGYLDWAVQTPATLPPEEAARQSLLVYWSDCAQLGQRPFEEIEYAGLLDTQELLEIAALVWPGERLPGDSYEALAARTGFSLQKDATERRQAESEGGF